MAVRKSTLEIEKDPWEWSEFNSLEALWSLRGERGLLVWTPIEELEVAVLNILPPINHIFWSLSEYYTAFEIGRTQFSQALSGLPDTRQVLRDFLVESCIEPKSFCAYEIFGGLTRPFGEYFSPETRAVNYFLRAHRHMSLAVPLTCRPAVSRYFHRQENVFGDEAFRECDENYFIYGGQESIGEFEKGLLHTAIEMVAPKRRREYLEFLQANKNSIEAWRIGLDVDFAYATRGIDAALLRKPDQSAVEEIAAIARVRADIAVKQCPLIVVQRFKDSLNTPGWDALDLADYREELRGVLDARLARFPIIQANPFAC